jgi:hypothetical protein
MLRVSIDLGGAEGRELWRSCRQVAGVKRRNCPGAKRLLLGYRGAMLDLAVYLQVSAREMVAPRPPSLGLQGSGRQDLQLTLLPSNINTTTRS